MSIANIIILVLLIATGVIGLAVGLVKGYTKVKTWANDYVLATLFTILLGLIAKNSEGTASAIFGIVVLVCAAAFILLCALISKILQKFIAKRLERRKENGKKGGFLGLFNRLFGGFTLALKGITLSAIIVVVLLTVLDLSGIEAIKNAIADCYSGGLWVMIKPHIFDFIVVGIMQLCIRHGFENGIVSSAWSLFVVALVGLAGYISYHLAFNVAAFNGPAESFGEVLEGSLGSAVTFLSGIGITPVVLARIIILIGFFILFGIVVALVAKFVPRLLHFARMGSAFYVIDGVLGALVSTVVVVALLLIIGNILQPLQGLEFAATLDSYFEGATVANFIYTDNILISFGMPPLLPLRDWLAPTT